MASKQGFLSDQWLVLVSVPLALAGLALSVFHPLFALLAGLFCALVSLRLFTAISRIIFKRDFNPPTRVPGLPWPLWSDWLLFIPWVITFVALLFTFGEIADCLSKQDLWKNWFSICG